MWPGFACYLNCIVVLIVASQGVKAQYVGDYCYTKSLAGVCTLTSKCPEVVRDIQKGKNPVVCSYQGSEAVVCCPKRNSQPNQQVWSNNNNNNNYYNNNQYYQQGGFTNQNQQQNPVNQINHNFPIQQPNQIYPMNQASSNNQNYREVVPIRHSPGSRRSEQKCEEYSKLATHSGSFTSLSILTSTQEVNIPTCTYPTGLIVGGEVAKTGEFPHMAVIGWTSNGEVDWKCGGSLISEYFVLTAAHCSAVVGIPPDTVRLGDQNLVRQDDNAQPQEYRIANVIVHPDYRHSSNYYDIALIRLSQQVIFTRFIRPACLWQSSYVNSSNAIATGWGQLEFAGERSDDLQKVALNIIDNNHCQQLYERSKKLRNGIVSSQLCAGYLEGGKDTCQGDSGGPIQVVTPRNQCIFHIIGITSFGKACAAVNAAGVYTRVSSYLDWIESNVWP
ncbi:serine protease snake-like isoform X4 [Bradysia coprophila]|uniref:serine protease snake-like isoform X4 n=1 Tax=Bradysia coprophila TaxID=38358 RepID=UPI00187D7E3F|nr:serine protease snake-like isoform X4 [Bradysia coprophila]